jgi:hypothetical protein
MIEITTKSSINVNPLDLSIILPFVDPFATVVVFRYIPLDWPHITCSPRPELLYNKVLVLL